MQHNHDIAGDLCFPVTSRPDCMSVQNATHSFEPSLHVEKLHAKEVEKVLNLNFSPSACIPIQYLKQIHLCYY